MNDQINKTEIMPEKLTATEERAILKARAKELARNLAEEEKEEAFLEVMEFSLGNEHYAFETAFVKEVFLLTNYTSLPGLPDFIIGIVNIRGQILSIMDLRKLFELPLNGLGELNKLIILKNENMEFGILADVILGTRLIGFHSLKESYNKMPGIGAEYLKAVTDEHLIILNAQNLLDNEKLIINQ